MPGSPGPRRGQHGAGALLGHRAVLASVTGDSLNQWELQSPLESSKPELGREAQPTRVGEAVPARGQLLAGCIWRLSPAWGWWPEL